MNNTLKITRSGDREIVITRVMDAPRELVWDAMSKPEFLKRWLLGPPGWEMTECENDQRVGGTFRHAWRHADGNVMAMHGTYREVVPFERVVRTETFDMGCDAQAGEQVGTMVLAEDKGKTTLTVTVTFPTKEACDGMLASGMEHGMAASYALLDEVLAAKSAA